MTTDNVHDTQPVRELASCLTDKLYGDKGYLSNALEADLLDKRDKAYYDGSQKYEGKSDVIMR